MSLLVIGEDFKFYKRRDKLYNKTTVSIQKYVPEHSDWVEFTLETPEKMRSCIAALNNQLIFLTESWPLRYARYDICTGTWLPMSQITPFDHEKVCIGGVCYAVLNDQLYAIGGFYANCRSSERVERWDPKTDTWSRVGYLKNARCWAKSAVLNGDLFVAGGKNGNDLLPYTEQYRPVTQEWKRRANINVPRICLGLTDFNGCLYAVGGFKNELPLPDVERYDFKSNKWTKLHSLSVARGNLACMAFENHLWAIGGGAYPISYNTVELYNAEKDVWSMLQPIKSAGRVTCIVLPIQIADCLLK